MNPFEIYLLQNEYRKLAELGDKLAEADKNLDWERSRPIIQALYANDTSAAVGFAPYTSQEKLILNLERYVNSGDFKKTHPESGEDIKLMALRRGRKVDLTVAMAMVDHFIEGENQYFKRKAEMVEAIDEFIDGQGGFEEVKVSLWFLIRRFVSATSTEGPAAANPATRLCSSDPLNHSDRNNLFSVPSLQELSLNISSSDVVSYGQRPRERSGQSSRQRSASRDS